MQCAPQRRYPGDMAVKMTLTLTIDGVTYGDLYEFVDAVRAAGVPGDERVRCIGSDEQGDRFEVEIGPDRRRAGAGRAASGALVGEIVEPGPGAAKRGPGAPAQPNFTAIADTVKSMVRNGDDLDRVIATLGDLRKFFR